MRALEFKIYYQHEAGNITDRIIELGQPIPHMGDEWAVIAKCQFTGLHDINGVKIFEGDILYRENFSNWIVIWENGGFRFYNQWNITITYPLRTFGVLDRQIIGNVYENPELNK